MAFILIRSPSNAPPVFLLDGSTETTAIRLEGKSNVNLRTSSSTIELFPAPPVPVIPKMGVLIAEALSVISIIASRCALPQFSAALIHLAIIGFAAPVISFTSPGVFSPTKKSDRSTKSLIIPCKPIFRPSSGWYNLVIP